VPTLIVVGRPPGEDGGGEPSAFDQAWQDEAPVAERGIGLAYSHDGTRLYATSGGTDAVYQFNAAPNCALTYAATIPLPHQAPPPTTSSFSGPAEHPCCGHRPRCRTPVCTSTGRAGWGAAPWVPSVRLHASGERAERSDSSMWSAVRLAH
jgi:hypothetical protein